MIHSEEFILKEQIKGLGVITLNRPAQFHAVNLPMVEAINQALDDFERDDSCFAILLKATPAPFFSAGGDIRLLLDYKKSNNFKAYNAFFSKKYVLCLRINTFSKPIVTVANGRVMGGGVGLLVYAPYRVMTDSAMLSMPETGIGFFPDVGSSYFFNQFPELSGFFYSLTSHPLSAAEAKHLNLIDAVIPTPLIHSFYEYLTQLKSPDEIKSALNAFSFSPPFLPLKHFKPVEEHFQHPTLEAILASLSTTAEGQSTKAALRLKSPTSLALFFTLLQQSKGLSLKESLERDTLLSEVFWDHPDFFEGIQAHVVTKTKNPQWTPAHLEEVSLDLFLPIIKRFSTKKEGQ